MIETASLNANELVTKLKSGDISSVDLCKSYIKRIEKFEKDIPWFKGKQPSTEVLVVFIWEEIVNHLEGCILHKIRIEETPTIYTDYYGPIDE